MSIKADEEFCSQLCTDELGWDLEKREYCRDHTSCETYDRWLLEKSKGEEQRMFYSLRFVTIASQATDIVSSSNKDDVFNIAWALSLSDYVTQFYVMVNGTPVNPSFFGFGEINKWVEELD